MLQILIQESEQPQGNKVMMTWQLTAYAENKLYKFLLRVILLPAEA